MCGVQRAQAVRSSKHIRVEIDGVEVANTKSSVRLYETGLPVRTYIPFTDVRADLLTPAELVTSCPYKVHNPLSYLLPLPLPFDYEC